jgi:hypothetical protein
VPEQEKAKADVKREKAKKVRAGEWGVEPARVKKKAVVERAAEAGNNI